jgi:KTSC domain
MELPYETASDPVRRTKPSVTGRHIVSRLDLDSAVGDLFFQNFRDAFRNLVLLRHKRVGAITASDLLHSPPQEAVVKYRENIDCRDVTQSSPVRRVCYDRTNKYMLINLNGIYYRHCEIDDGTVSSLLTADSMEGFYNVNVRNQFDCRRRRPSTL